MVAFKALLCLVEIWGGESGPTKTKKWAKKTSRQVIYHKKNQNLFAGICQCGGGFKREWLNSNAEPIRTFEGSNRSVQRSRRCI